MTESSVVFFFFFFSHPQGSLALWNIGGKSPPEGSRHDTDIPLILPSLFKSCVLLKERTFFHPQKVEKIFLYISIVPAKLYLLFAVHTDVSFSSMSASLLYEVLVWSCFYLHVVRKILLDVSIVLAQLYILFAVHADACLLSLSILQLNKTHTWPFSCVKYVGETSLGCISIVLAQHYFLLAVHADTLLPTTHTSQVYSMLKTRTFNSMSLAKLFFSAAHDVIERQERYSFSLLPVFCQSLLLKVFFTVDDRPKCPILLTLDSGSIKAAYRLITNFFCLLYFMVSSFFSRQNLENYGYISEKILSTLYFRASREKKATPGPRCPVRHSLWSILFSKYLVTAETNNPVIYTRLNSLFPFSPLSVTLL